MLIAKYLDHVPLYRQESIFERAGLALPRSTLAQWVGACGVRLQPLADALKAALLTRTVLHADETPVPMLKPGLGRTHRAYLWSYSSSEYDELPAVDLRLCRQLAAGCTPVSSWEPGPASSSVTTTRATRRSSSAV